MAHSQRLRLRDVREVYRLVGECQELWADPLAWRTHAAERLCALTGARLAMGGEAEGFFGARESRLVQLWYVGGDEADRERHQNYLAESGYHFYDAPFVHYVAQRRPLITRSHEQLTTQSEWCNSKLFNEFFRPSLIDDRLLSFAEVVCSDGTSISNCFTLLRGLGHGSFTRRDRGIIHLFHNEIVPLIGTRLATCRQASFFKLSPRLREVLELLLAGEGEKQIARRLGLSCPTVNQYVGALYRRFGVCSRAELLAYFIARRPKEAHHASASR